MCSSAASGECRALRELLPVDLAANIPHDINAAARLHQDMSCRVEQHTWIWSVQLSAAPQFARPCFFHCFPPHLQHCPTHLSFLDWSTAHQDELPQRQPHDRHIIAYICPHQPAFSSVQIILGTTASKTTAIQHELQRAGQIVSTVLFATRKPQLTHHHNIFKTFNEQKWFRSTCHQIAEASLLAHLAASQLPCWQLLADVLRVC